MILNVPLRAGTSLGNVVYEWIAGGVVGPTLNTGITQPNPAYPIFRIDTIPPTNAEELIIWDSSDLTNWNVGAYKLALIVPAPGVIPPSPVPVTPQQQIILIVKAEWMPILNDNQELPISNLGALRHGLEALQCEDARDYQRAKQLWLDAKMLLAEEAQDDDGAGSESIVNVDDTYCMAEVGESYGYYEGGWRYGGW